MSLDDKTIALAFPFLNLNGVQGERYTVRAGDLLADGALSDELTQAGPFRVVLANIVSDVIIPLSAFAGRFSLPGGLFLCSGIIDTRAAEVEAALRKNGMAVLERLERDGWCAMAAAME